MLQAQSDIDLVCFVSPEDFSTIATAASPHILGSGSPHNLSLRFGLLNLILLTDHRDYDLWKDGTDDLKERKPVTRDQAVRTFEALRAQRELAEQVRRNTVPVSVSLYELARVPAGLAVLPEELKAMLDPLEKEPEDKTRWGVIADWLDEHDEPLLAAAFRYVSKRPIKIRKRNPHRSDGVWGFYDVPAVVDTYYTDRGFEPSTLLGATAALASALDKARKETE